jgi:hypothetical protein
VFPAGGTSDRGICGGRGTLSLHFFEGYAFDEIAVHPELGSRYQRSELPILHSQFGCRLRTQLYVW